MSEPNCQAGSRMGCGVSGWGWRDERWGDRLAATPVLLRFPSGGWLSDEEFDDLLAFVRDGLLDARASPARLRHQIPQHVPSGRPVLTFQ